MAVLCGLPETHFSNGDDVLSYSSYVGRLWHTCRIQSRNFLYASPTQWILASSFRLVYKNVHSLHTAASMNLKDYPSEWSMRLRPSRVWWQRFWKNLNFKIAHVYICACIFKELQWTSTPPRLSLYKSQESKPKTANLPQNKSNTWII